MAYQTLEVELENGRVRPMNAETLPVKARALLTILETGEAASIPTSPQAPSLRRFLTAPDFPLTPEQLQASLEADPYEQ